MLRIPKLRGVARLQNRHARVSQANARHFSQTVFLCKEQKDKDDADTVLPNNKDKKQEQKTQSHKRGAPTTTGAEHSQFNKFPEIPYQEKEVRTISRIYGDHKYSQHEERVIKVDEQKNDETGEQMQTIVKTSRKWDRKHYVGADRSQEKVTKEEKFDEKQETKVVYTGSPGQYQRHLVGDEEGTKQLAHTPDPSALSELPMPNEQSVSFKPRAVSKGYENVIDRPPSARGDVSRTFVSGRVDTRKQAHVGTELHGDSIKEVRKSIVTRRRREERKEVFTPAPSIAPGQFVPKGIQDGQTPAAREPRGRGSGGMRNYLLSKNSESLTLPPIEDEKQSIFPFHAKGATGMQDKAGEETSINANDLFNRIKEDIRQRKERKEMNKPRQMNALTQTRPQRIQQLQRKPQRQQHQRQEQLIEDNEEEDDGDDIPEEYKEDADGIDPEELEDGLDVEDESYDTMIPMADLEAISNMVQEQIKQQYLLTHYQDYMNVDARLGSAVFERDYNAGVISENLSSLQTEFQTQRTQVTADESNMLEQTIPIMFQQLTLPRAKQPLEYMGKPENSIQDIDSILSQFAKSGNPSLINYDALENFKESQLKSLKANGKLTPQVLKNYGNHLSMQELIEIICDDLRSASILQLASDDTQLQSIIDNYTNLGRAANRYSENPIPEEDRKAQMRQAITEGLELKRRDQILFYSPGKIAMKHRFYTPNSYLDIVAQRNAEIYSQAVETLDELKESIVAYEKIPKELLEQFEEEEGIQNVQANEVKRMEKKELMIEEEEEEGEGDEEDEERSSLLREEHIMEHHILVKEKRFFHLLHEFQRDVVEDKVDMPHIPDTMYAMTAGKYGAERVVAPFERNFDEALAAIPNEQAKQRITEYARAISRNIGLTFADKKRIINDLAFKFRTLTDDAFVAPSNIRNGKLTHFHQQRVNPRDKPSVNDLYKQPGAK